MGIRFDTSGEELRIFRPDGEPFRSHAELEQRAIQAEQERKAERVSRQQAEQRAAKAEQECEQLVAKLREMGIDPEALDSGETAG